MTKGPKKCCFHEFHRQYSPHLNAAHPAASVKMLDTETRFVCTSDLVMPLLEPPEAASKRSPVEDRAERAIGIVCSIGLLGFSAPEFDSMGDTIPA